MQGFIEFANEMLFSIVVAEIFILIAAWTGVIH